MLKLLLLLLLLLLLQLLLLLLLLLLKLDMKDLLGTKTHDFIFAQIIFFGF